MKYFTIIVFCCFTLSLMSCEEDTKIRQAEVIRAQKYNDSILQIISSNWKFDVKAPSPKVQQRLANWNEWQQFMNELQQKPKSAIDSYKAKTKDLAGKADQLKNNIPAGFDKPQVKSRIGVLTTKIKSLYTFTNLDVPQDKKIVRLTREVTNEVTSIQNQFDEIIRFNEIPKEMGEEEMLRALDTVRMANPDAQPQPQKLRPAPTNTNVLKRQRIQQLKSTD